MSDADINEVTPLEVAYPYYNLSDADIEIVDIPDDE